MYFKDETAFKETSGYTLENGWYPRVTKIVEIKSKPALEKFIAEVGFEKSEDIKTKSANEGTRIHEIFEKILIGEQPIVDPSIAPSIEAAIHFIKKNNIQVDPAYVEKRIVNHTHRYAGTIDALALIGGKFGILDIKTSMAIYRDYNLQTAAYMDALKDQVKNLQTRWIMRIDQARTCTRCASILRSKGGRDTLRAPYPRPYDFQECAAEQHEWSRLTGIIELKEFPYWRNDFEAFLGAKKLWEWEHDYWLKKIGYV